MSFTISQIKSHLTGMGHGGTLNKVRNINELFERTSSIFLQKCKPVETIRLGTLSSTIHDDVYNYPLQSDFNSLIDLMPQDNRKEWDLSYRTPAGQFDLEKAQREKTISIEGSEGSKIIRINWRSRSGKVVHRMDSLTENGTWSAVATAANLSANSIFKVSGTASIEFDVVATGDGIENTTMSVLDLSDEDEVADFFVWMYFGTAPTSVSLRWGNDMTSNYWSSVAQTTQVDGTSFKVGWNLIKFPWNTATETGTVTPSTIDAFRITVASSAQVNVRVDNIICSIGRNFDTKYYTKYLFKNTSGAYISKPTTDDDVVLVDNDSLPIFLFECLKSMAQQLQGTDGAFDITYAENELKTLYPAFRSEHPSQRRKMVGNYGALPRFKR